MNYYRFFADTPPTKRKSPDILLLASILLLTGLGLFALFVCSQSYGERMFGNPFHFIKRQAVCVAVGIAAFVLFASVDTMAIRKLLPFIVIGTVILCLLTFVPGVSIERNGARRWIKMPFSFTLQPSEVVKFSFVLFLANLFDKQLNMDERERTVMPAVIGLFFFTVLVLAQKDFSTSVFIFCAGLVMFFATGAKLIWFFPSLALIIPAMFFVVFQETYRIERIIAFLRPNEGAHTFNYQSMASRRAISAGGFWGSGIGSGMVWVNSVPEVQADYIFAGWAEAMGFFGVVAYFALLAIFAWRALRAAFLCTDRFASYSAFGLAAVIILQSLVNCSVVCGALPATGIPLPFFSLGGSSIIMTLAMCGFIVGASEKSA